MGNIYLNIDLPIDRIIDIELIANQGKTFSKRIIERKYRDVIYVSSVNTISILEKHNFNTLITSRTTGNKINYVRIFEDTLYGIERDSNSILTIKRSFMCNHSTQN